VEGVAGTELLGACRGRLSPPPLRTAELGPNRRIIHTPESDAVGDAFTAQSPYWDAMENSAVAVLLPADLPVHHRHLEHLE
jgi:hypothetical protein